MDSRPRKTTLETFNEELAILDRPLEGDVEYYDERPRRRQRWAGTSLVIIGAVFFAGAGVLFFSHPDPETIIAAARAAAARSPQAPLTPVAAAPAEAPPATAEAPAIEAPAATAEAPAIEAPAQPAPQPTTAEETSTANAPSKLRSPPPRAAWIKLGSASRRHH